MQTTKSGGVTRYEIQLRSEYSSFPKTLSFYSVKTPKGKVRGFSIKDDAVLMADQPLCDPADSIGVTVNDGEKIHGEINKKELKKFLKAFLKDLEK